MSSSRDGARGASLDVVLEVHADRASGTRVPVEPRREPRRVEQPGVGEDEPEKARRPRTPPRRLMGAARGSADLVRVWGARHIPTVDAPYAVTAFIADNRD